MFNTVVMSASIGALALAATPHADASRRALNTYSSCNLRAARQFYEERSSVDLIARRVKAKCQLQFLAFRSAMVSPLEPAMQHSIGTRLDQQQAVDARVAVEAMRLEKTLTQCVRRADIDLDRGSLALDELVDKVSARCLKGGTLAQFPETSKSAAALNEQQAGDLREIDRGMVRKLILCTRSRSSKLEGVNSRDSCRN